MNPAISSAPRFCHAFVGAVLGVLLGVVLPGCGGEDATGPGDISGTYALVAFEGDTLPAFVSPVPPSTQGDGSDTGCDILATEGGLTLDGTALTFHLFWVTRNSCNGVELSRHTIEGTYENFGPTVRFRDPSAVPPDFVFNGLAGEDRIVVDLGGPPELTFER